MKKLIYTLFIASTAIFATSCEKNELMPEQNAEINEPVGGAAGRGGIGSGEGSPCVQPVTSPLNVERVSGGGCHHGPSTITVTTVGTITITNSPDTISVEFTTTGGYKLREVKVWGGLQSTAPVTSAGNANFNLFQVKKTNLNLLNTYTAKIPTSAIGAGNPGVIMAYAKVYKSWVYSDSWGEGPSFTATGNAEYISYTPCAGN